MKHRLNILSLCVLLLAGCAKDPDSGTSNGSKVEIALAVASVNASATRAGETPVPQGTSFRVVVYKAGNAPATTTPVATGIYTTIDDAGNASAQTAADRILLDAGNYDFYFVAPPTELTAGAVTAQNGDEVLTTGKQTVNVTPDANGRCAISVAFARRSAMLDIVVYYKTDDDVTTSLAIPVDKSLLISGLFTSATVPLNGSAVVSTGTTGTGTLLGDKLKELTEPAGTNTQGFSTFTVDTHRGLCVLPGTTDLGVTVPVTINGSVSRNMQAHIADVLLEEGKYYTLKVQVSLTAPVVATIEEWVPSIGNSDEGMGEFVNYMNQPANCYITRPGVLIRFDATKKPRTATDGACSNPSTVETDKALSNDLNKEDIASVKVVWQTAINHSSPADGTKSNMILQHVSYNAGTGVCTVIPHSTGYGNAVIAAYAADGTTILWNWHIWVTEGKVQANVNTGNMSLNGGGKFMDRNLGALAATTTQPTTADAYKYFGVLYQHGRPTPFTGQGAGTSVNTYTKIYNGAGTEIIGDVGGYTKNTTAVSTVTAALKTPNTYYCQPLTNNNYLWVSIDLSLWSDYGSNSKSIYDPCPYGYRVPENGSWNGMTSTNWGGTYITNGSTWSNTWWPIAGYRGAHDGIIHYVGYDTYCWSSTYASTYGSYNLYFTYSGSVVPSRAYPCSNGFSVRCVQEGY